MTNSEKVEIALFNFDVCHICFPYCFFQPHFYCHADVSNFGNRFEKEFVLLSRNSRDASLMLSKKQNGLKKL